MPKPEHIVKRTKKEIQELKIQFVNTLKTLAVTSLGLVAALAWNAAIQKLFEVIFPNNANSLTAMFTYAIILTIIIVFVTYYLTKLADRVGGKSEDKEEKK